MRLVSITILAFIALVLMSACTSQPSTATTGSAETITVTVKEWAIEPQEIKAKAGKTTFVIKNAGNIEHNFDIEG